MNRKLKETESYRERFAEPGAGEMYEDSLARRVDAVLWQEIIRSDLQKILKKIRDSGAERYLDFACGTGRILMVSTALFDDVSAIDISPEMLSIARERNPGARLIVGDITENPDLVKEIFDCITLFRFILNAEPGLRREVLQWLSGHLYSGGYLVGNIHMQVPSIGGWLCILRHKFLGRQVNYISRQETADLLAEAGFRIESWKGYRILPTIFGRPLLGKRLQIFGERILLFLGLGRFGADHIFVARKI